MHVGIVIDPCGFIVWKSPVARTSPKDALADAEEYLGDLGAVDELLSDVSDIDQQLDDLDKVIKARRAEVTRSMAAEEECSCSRCISGREYIRQQLAS